MPDLGARFAARKRAQAAGESSLRSVVQARARARRLAERLGPELRTVAVEHEAAARLSAAAEKTGLSETQIASAAIEAHCRRLFAVWGVDGHQGRRVLREIVA